MNLNRDNRYTGFISLQDAIGRQGKLEQMIAKKTTEKDEAALRYLLASADGRWFLMRFFERCHLLAAATPSIAMESDYFIWEGERRSALTTLNGVRSLGKEGLDGKQLAEREYFAFQEQLDRLRQEAEEGEDDA